MSSKTETSQLALIKVGFACVLVIFVCVFTLCLFVLGYLFVVLFCLLLFFFKLECIARPPFMSFPFVFSMYVNESTA